MSNLAHLAKYRAGTASLALQQRDTGRLDGLMMVGSNFYET